MADLSLKGTLGQVGNLGKQLGKGVLEGTKKTAKATVGQIGLEQTDAQKQELKGAVSTDQKTADVNTQDIVKALYGSSSNSEEPAATRLQSPKAIVDGGQTEALKGNSSEIAKSPQMQTAQKIASENPEKSSEEMQKMTALRQQLHRETYYDPTFNPQRKQEEEKIEEQQKEQEEEQKKRWELQEKKEKQKEESAVLQQQKKSIEKRPGAG